MREHAANEAKWMSEPQAYFLTWTTRGAWLHGDSRGSVDRDRNLHGHPTEKPSLNRHLRRTIDLHEEPFELSVTDREQVHQAIEKVAAVRGWTILALNVRSNHVHVVLQSPGYTPERVMQQFKSWGTRALRDVGNLGAEQSAWTRHGSTKYLWDADSVARAVEYVRDFQDRWPRAHARGSDGVGR